MAITSTHRCFVASQPRVVEQVIGVLNLGVTFSTELSGALDPSCPEVPRSPWALTEREVPEAIAHPQTAHPLHHGPWQDDVARGNCYPDDSLILSYKNEITTMLRPRLPTSLAITYDPLPTFNVSIPKRSLCLKCVRFPAGVFLFRQSHTL
jgi:hypothetical protein